MTRQTPLRHRSCRKSSLLQLFNYMRHCRRREASLPHTYPSSKEVCGNERAETRKRPLYLSSFIYGKESRWFRMIQFTHRFTLSGRCMYLEKCNQGSARGSFAHNVNGKDNGRGCKVGGKKNEPNELRERIITVGIQTDLIRASDDAKSHLFSRLAIAMHMQNANEDPMERLRQTK